MSTIKYYHHFYKLSIAATKKLYLSKFYRLRAGDMTADTNLR